MPREDLRGQVEGSSSHLSHGGRRDPLLPLSVHLRSRHWAHSGGPAPQRLLPLRAESKPATYTVTSFQTTVKCHEEENKENETGVRIRGHFSLKTGAGKALQECGWTPTECLGQETGSASRQKLLQVLGTFQKLVHLLHPSRRGSKIVRPFSQ